MTTKPQCRCAICSNEFDFDVNEFLIGEIAAGNVAIFAGAGVSTESNNAAPHSLYQEFAHELDLQTNQIPFPDLAQKIVEKPDGRFSLMRIIQDRFDNISRFRDLKNMATRFHTELATMPYFDTFITTNWDRHFEDYCDAKPFTYDTDMRFWNVPRRRVLKIHGTIDDYSSIVATRTDYDQCAKKLHTSLVGAKLKDVLSTKTCIFVGYSLRDEDFQEIFSFVRTSLGKFDKTHFFVSPKVPERALPSNVKHIQTDGTYFLRRIKDHMTASGCYMEDSAYEIIAAELYHLHETHKAFHTKYDIKKFPQAIACAAYQDGLMHGYKRILDGRSSGRFSDLHELQNLISSYYQKISSYRRIRSYIDVAYFQGYNFALQGFLLLKKRQFELVPHYYSEGIGPMTSRAYGRIFKKLPTVHKAAYLCCKRELRRWNLASGVILQHMPWG